LASDDLLLLRKTHRYSLRDFRSIFATTELGTTNTGFGGQYDSEQRRWRFATRESAREARTFLNLRPEPIAIAIPGLEHHYPLVKSHDGFLPSVRRFDADARAHKLFPGNVALFANQADADAATLLLYGTLQATLPDREAALKALKQAQPEWFGEDLVLLRCRLETACWQHQAREITARVRAAQEYRPPDGVAGGTSAADAATQANENLRRLMRLDVRWNEQPLPTHDVAGVLIGRSDYHLAVVTGEDGAGHIFRRDRVQFPMRRDGTAERSPERGATIVLRPHASGAWTAYQDGTRSIAEWDRDLSFGPLLLQGRVAAGTLAPIVEMDPTVDEDFDGTISAVGEQMVAIMDKGATIALMTHAAVPNPSVGARVQTGPSYSQRPALQHGARR
jgi:hypothetical protein